MMPRYRLERVEQGTTPETVRLVIYEVRGWAEAEEHGRRVRNPILGDGFGVEVLRSEYESWSSDELRRRIAEFAKARLERLRQARTGETLKKPEEDIETEVE